MKLVELVCGMEGQRQELRGALHTTPRRLDVALSRRHDQESSEASAREGTSDNLC